MTILSIITRLICGIKGPVILSNETKIRDVLSMSDIGTLAAELEFELHIYIPIPCSVGWVTIEDIVQSCVLIKLSKEQGYDENKCT